MLGNRKLNAITNEAVQLLKSKLRDKAPKTVNNVLTVLNMLLKTATNWAVIDSMPCTVRLLPTPQGSAGFHEVDAYERLVVAGKALDARTYLIALLGGEAGLRCGEMMALEWSDVDPNKRQLCVARSEWKGHVTVPKGSRLEALQRDEIPGNQGFFLRACPSLQLALAPERGFAVVMRFGIGECDREPTGGECATTAFIVSQDAELKICRLADVQRAVGAAQDV